MCRFQSLCFLWFGGKEGNWLLWRHFQHVTSRKETKGLSSLQFRVKFGTVKKCLKLQICPTPSMSERRGREIFERQKIFYSRKNWVIHLQKNVDYRVTKNAIIFKESLIIITYTSKKSKFVSDFRVRSCVPFHSGYNIGFNWYFTTKKSPLPTVPFFWRPSFSLLFPTIWKVSCKTV